MTSFRWFHYLYAKLHGYFWLPCPICGRNFGGHEAGPYVLMINPYDGILVCSNEDCGNEAKKKSEAIYADMIVEGIYRKIEDRNPEKRGSD